MRIARIVNIRRLAAAGALVALMLTSKVRAQVLEQVPSDAVVIIKIKDLGAMSTKVAKMAKSFGLDEINPDMKDPLGSLLDKAHMTKGVNRAGDAALAIFARDEKAGKGVKSIPKDGGPPVVGGDMASQTPEAVAVVPVSDYEAFVGNFEKANATEPGADVTAVKDPEHDDKTMYIAHRGNYAVLSDHKANLSGHANGFKLAGRAAKEAASRDAVVLLNVPAIRDKALPELKNNRKKIIDDMNKELANNPQFKPYQPVFNTLVGQGLDFAQNFLNDAQSIVFSFDLSDDGVAGGGMVEFAPDSKFGTSVAKIKPGEGALLTGLPDHKYIAFGGFSCDPKSTSHISDDFIDPIIKGLKGTDTDTARQIVDALKSYKTVMGSIHNSAAGWVMPTKPLGQESVVQQVVVTYGDAKVIAGSEKKLLASMTDLMGAIPQQAGSPKMKFEFGAAPTTIDGAEMNSYSMKMDFDPNDPRAAQMQQGMAMMYGANGLNGKYGAVNDKAFVLVQGGSDELLTEVIDAARTGKDVLGDSAGVKAVASHLQNGREFEYYFALDNFVNTIVRYAQGFGVPVKLKLPPNLPPLAMSAGSDGSALRFDYFIPAQTMQSVIAAGIQTWTQMQNGGAGGGL
ncbi:MAG TPA: hypothetical protein VFC78_14910 [Tepidisphaeraceae bacterium]|nr:hypothetical protein [Tepidisphaeraceae bacterium]